MDRDSLYLLVTEAIIRAETLESLEAPGTVDAYRDVSLLEELIADCIPASSPEGALARRGAVGAAIDAGDMTRASELVARFSDEDGATDSVRADLREIMADGFSAPTAPPPEQTTFRDVVRVIRETEIDGVVLAVEADGFVGWLVPADGEPYDQEAVFSFDEVAPDERKAIRTGTVFHWHTEIIEDPGHQLIRRSFLVFPKIPPPSLVRRLAGKHLADRVEEVFGTRLPA